MNLFKLGRLIVLELLIVNPTKINNELIVNFDCKKEALHIGQENVFLFISCRNETQSLSVYQPVS